MTRRHDASGNTRRLLAVDDNRLILKIIEAHFVQNGWDVKTAENVSAARVALAAARPDVIVSDVIMPGTDGWAFFDEVRRRDETAVVPFIFLTVEHALTQRLRGLKLGADDYMTKPFAVEELHARVERLLDRSEALKGEGSKGDDALLSGSVEHLAVSDLLQILALNRKTGTVRLRRQGGEGRIEFLNGRIVDARAGSAGGQKALFRMLGWVDATFRVVPREKEAHAATIDAATATVLMEGLVSLDEWSHRKALLPAPETRIEPSRDAQAFLAALAPGPAAIDLVARSKNGITVVRAIDESPYPDAQVAEAICTLLAKGVLKAASEGRKTPLVTR